MLTKNQSILIRQCHQKLPQLAAELASNETASREKIRQLYYFVLDLLTREDEIHFSTGFAALSYLGVKFGLEGKLMFRLHVFRKFLSSEQTENTTINWKSGFYGLAVLVSELTHQPLDPSVAELEVHLKQLNPSGSSGMNYIPSERVLFTGKKTENGWEVLRESEGGKRAELQLDQTVFEKGLNELAELRITNITLLLKDIRTDEGLVLKPGVLIIEPDFIIDVTAVASCVQPNGNYPSIHLMKKFLPPKTTKYIMAGHVANYFLDRLMTDPSINYQDLMRESFRIDPIAFCTLPDEDIQFIANRAFGFYKNLYKLIRKNFLSQGRNLDSFSIEPSFYSPENGLQGRLDLLYREPGKRKSEIFELKSGGIFRPNSYGINPSHYAQTMLYYTILRDLYPNDLNLSAYIIYAKENKESLRYAPVARPFQNQTLALRNEILVRELKMQQIDQVKIEEFINYLDLEDLIELKGFTGTDTSAVVDYWKKLDPLEKSYLLHFYAFVSREYGNSKVNNNRSAEERRGLSALWLDDTKSKEERFAILSDLEIIEDRSFESNPQITFSRKRSTQKLANFRLGDVVVLYVRDKGPGSVPFTQVYRGTLLEINSESLTVRLRSTLSKSERPDTDSRWTVEPDVLESGFRHFFNSLSLFMRAHPDSRKLWMGIRPPRQGTLKPIPKIDGLTGEQKRVLQKIISCRDYFLLWGPPGTGKTSVVIKNLIRLLVEEEGETILLMAYTNRAVDEICDALKSISPQLTDRAIRIGSRYGTHPDHQHLLLDRQIEKCKLRGEVKKLLSGKKILLSTVSSFYGKSEIQELVSIDTVIIDEASQILEPYINGLLTGFKRTILVGDHCQLPAIATQDNAQSKVRDTNLHELGLTNLSDSLFERLYLLAMKKQWDYTYDRLTCQGRMHVQISSFVSRQFYEGKLKCLSNGFPVSARLNAELNSYYALSPENSLHSNLLKDRLIFIDHPAEGLPLKTNEGEAQTAVHLAKEFFQHKSGTNIEGKGDSLGIICPYKAQIALIKTLLESELPQFCEWITVDTVERYQGGARDVIILSLCTNHPAQLTTLVNASRNGLDRKLNVALTRAREQIVVLGNADILQKNTTYAELIKACRQLELGSITVL